MYVLFLNINSIDAQQNISRILIFFFDLLCGSDTVFVEVAIAGFGNIYSNDPNHPSSLIIKAKMTLMPADVLLKTIYFIAG